MSLTILSYVTELYIFAILLFFLQLWLKYIIFRNTVRLLLTAVDADGVALRRARKLRRRVYRSLGPNYVIHLDGYDKLKRFGFPIHGAIDGYSAILQF